MKRLTIVMLTLAIGLASLSLGCKKGEEGTKGGAKPGGQPTTAPSVTK